MSVVEVETLIIGGGQAGLAMSEHLAKRGVQHLIVERCRIAERWRSERWDSLVANGPAWHDRFPSKHFAGIDPDGFATKAQIVDYLVVESRSKRCMRIRRVPAFVRILPRASLSRPMSSLRQDRFNARSFPRPFRSMRASIRCIPPLTAIPTSCARGRY
jgi:hypothetical protein